MLITTVFYPFLGNAQSSSNTPIYDKLVSEKSPNIDMGELSSHERFLINVTSSTLVPWGIKIYKLLPNGMQNLVYTDDCGGFLASQILGEPKYINVSFPANEADEYDQGYYFLNIYKEDVVLDFGLQINLVPFLPTEWHVVIKRYSDEQPKSEREQLSIEDFSENTTVKSQQPTENGMAKALPIQPIDPQLIDSEGGQSPFADAQTSIENVSENVTVKSQQPTENGMAKALPIQSIDPQLIDSEGGQSPFADAQTSIENVSENVTEMVSSNSNREIQNATKVKPSENFTENGTRVVLRLPHSSIIGYRSIRSQPSSENLTENATKIKPVEVIDLANELL